MLRLYLVGICKLLFVYFYRVLNETHKRILMIKKLVLTNLCAGTRRSAEPCSGCCNLNKPWAPTVTAYYLIGLLLCSSWSDELFNTELFVLKRKFKKKNTLISPPMSAQFNTPPAGNLNVK